MVDGVNGGMYLGFWWNHYLLDHVETGVGEK